MDAGRIMADWNHVLGHCYEVNPPGTGILGSRGSRHPATPVPTAPGHEVSAAAPPAPHIWATVAPLNVEGEIAKAASWLPYAAPLASPVLSIFIARLRPAACVDC